MSSSRPSWDWWGLEMARAASTRADCTRRTVGAVLVTSDRSIASTGYNGAPPGEPGCLSSGACPRARSGVEPGSSYDTGPGSCIAVHAEQNALLRAAWADMKGSTLYVTEQPCTACSRMIRATPVERIIYPGWEEPDT